MPEGLSFVEKDSEIDRKMQRMKQDGYSFFEEVREVVISGPEYKDPVKEYVIWFKDPDEMTFERFCGMAISNLTKRTMTTDLVNKAWKLYNVRIKYEKYEDFLDEIDENTSFIEEIYEESYWLPLYKRLSEIVHQARPLLQYRVRVKV